MDFGYLFLNVAALIIIIIILLFLKNIYIAELHFVSLFPQIFKVKNKISVTDYERNINFTGKIRTLCTSQFNKTNK